jgi:hypothetical protein
MGGKEVVKAVKVHFYSLPRAGSTYNVGGLAHITRAGPPGYRS